MSYFPFKYLRYLFYRYPAFKLKNQHHRLLRFSQIIKQREFLICVYLCNQWWKQFLSGEDTFI